jgi:peptidoglycan/xylan/chitin deacetylase (PgdA/CDA1 family)
MLDDMIAITIDCEEWNSPLLRGKEDPENNNTTYSRLGNTALLKIFEKHDIKATFFITGFYAEREPEDVKRIVKAGHEIACHGYEHNYRGRTFDIDVDVKKAKEVVERVSGVKVKGFRAPQVQYSKELLQILDKNGFVYDSSLHPAFLPGYYNNRKFPLQVHKPLSECSIKEIPVAVMPRTRLPIVWMFMRNLGIWYTQLGVNGIVRRGITANLYFHSWEFTRLRSNNVPGYFVRKTGKPFLRMLEKFIVKNKKNGFCTLSEVV